MEFRHLDFFIDKVCQSNFVLLTKPLFAHNTSVVKLDSSLGCLELVALQLAADQLLVRENLN